MNFCQECSSVLYPVEKEGRLVLVCRICEYEEDSKTALVKRNVYKSTSNQTWGTRKYLIYERSYPRTNKVECPNKECPSASDKKLQEAIFFNDPLKLTYICTACNTEWKI